MKNRKRLLIIIALSFSIFLLLPNFLKVNAIYIPPTATRLWANSVGWSGQWGWFTGPQITALRLTAPLNMNFQCFQNLSSPQGWLDNALFEVWGPNGFYMSRFRSGATISDSQEWRLNLSQPGTYTFKCSRFGTNAETQVFTILPACSPTAPVAAVLNSPADNSQVNLLPGRSVNVSYNANNGWGVGCPAAQIVQLQTSIGCNGVFVNNTSPTLISPLNVGDTVCWRVVKSNGSLSSTSPIWRFTVRPDEKPWVMTYNGDLSAKGGVSASIPSSVSVLNENLLGSNNRVVLQSPVQAFTSTYGLISGNSVLPTNKQSKLKQFTTNYLDLSLTPPKDSGVNDWYQYSLNTVQSNLPNPIPQITGNNTVVQGRTTSSFFGVTPGTKNNVVILGRLDIAENVVCDTNTIFFIKPQAGNPPIAQSIPNVALRIAPNFTNSTLQNGCIFIVDGDILISSGTQSSPALNVDSPTLARYDIIEAGLITNGSVISNRDVFNPLQKGDGLVISGSVISKDISWQRDINLNGNQFQPAQVFIYDPRYREIFKNEFKVVRYSLREVGFSN